MTDNCFGAKENLEYINDSKKYFIIGIKSNCTIALSKNDKTQGQSQQVSSLNLKDGQSIKVWLKGLESPVMLIRKIFINEDNSTDILYLVLNDLDHDSDHLYEIYQKWWQIKIYHESIKQNANKSLTKKVISRSNHIFASIISFCKLGMLQLKICANHFALIYIISSINHYWLYHK
ncbi:MAG: hypothetical protein MTP17_01110 [Candidatus Midichloria sp.]|nr:MAG: hypothetical protein MTP17_01110 [Candidatus Midichloria sp.]